MLLEIHENERGQNRRVGCLGSSQRSAARPQRVAQRRFVHTVATEGRCTAKGPLHSEMPLFNPLGASGATLARPQPPAILPLRSHRALRRRPHQVFPHIVDLAGIQ